MARRKLSSTWTTSKIVVAAFLLLSFALFFLSWINISLTVFGQKLTISALFQYAAESIGYSSAEQFKNELYSSIIEASEDMAYDGIQMDPKQMTATLELISDSKISPIEAARIFSYSSSLLRELKNYFSRNIQDYYGEEKMIASFIVNSAGKASFAAVIIWILIIAVIATFILSFYFLLNDQKKGIILYSSVLITLFSVMAIMTARINSGIKQIGNMLSSLSYLASELLFGDLGINFSSSTNLKITNLSFAAYLSCIFAVGAILYTILDGKAFGAGSIGHISIPPIKIPDFHIPTVKFEEKWTCKKCGKKMGIGYIYCASCGTKRPDRKCCPKCGRFVDEDALFCTNCGAGLESEKSHDPIETNIVCKTCGSTVRYNAEVCPNCGHDPRTASHGFLVPPTDDDF